MYLRLAGRAVTQVGVRLEDTSHTPLKRRDWDEIGSRLGEI